MEKKSLNVFEALLPIITVVILGLLSVLKWKIGMVIPLFGSILAASILGLLKGHTWKALQDGLVAGVSRALPALFIMLVVGAIIGSWIAGGIIPALIYYSLKIISPQIFIPATALITAVIATATGTSFTSIATIGLALMATGIGMGFPAPILAGAVISGAYFGDSMSPLSDTTNLASAVTGSDLFDLIKHLMKVGIPALGISLVAYYFIGLGYVGNVSANFETVQTILGGIEKAFNVTPLLFIVPAVTIFLSVKKVPALPSLVIIALLGAATAMIFQRADIAGILRSMTFGYKCNTGIKMIDSLLTRGGITSMGSVVILLTSATALGGILETIGALDAILKPITKHVKKDGQLIFATTVSSLTVGFATGAQLLAIILPARMFLNEYKNRNLEPVNLARTAQAVGCICINLVPWSVPAMFAKDVLAVEPAQYMQYLFFPFAILALVIIYGFTGFTTKHITSKEGSK